MNHVELAKAVIASADARENSFDKEMAARLREAPGFSDFNTCYKLNLWQACQENAGEFAQPVYMLLTNSWNDALSWAELAVKENVEPANSETVNVSRKRLERYVEHLRVAGYNNASDELFAMLHD